MGDRLDWDLGFGTWELGLLCLSNRPFRAGLVNAARTALKLNQRFNIIPRARETVPRLAELSYCPVAPLRALILSMNHPVSLEL
ncbi:MAG TPA: hypothetical protein VMY18_07240, partial [Acidobacteriota bacterium]|nr:hypothetical protein [Acidobacteriota bacterium]